MKFDSSEEGIQLLITLFFKTVKSFKKYIFFFSNIVPGSTVGGSSEDRIFLNCGSGYQVLI